MSAAVARDHASRDSQPRLRVSPETSTEPRKAIARLAEEIAHASRRAPSPAAFFQAALPRLLQATGARGAVAWRRSGKGDWSVAASAGEEDLETLSLDAGHASFLQNVLSTERAAQLAPRQSGDDAETDAPSNPTDGWLLACPLVIGREPFGVLELIQRGDARPASMPGYLRFTADVASEAAACLERTRLRDLQDREQWRVACDKFVAEIHGAKTVRRTCYQIANAAPTVSSADRVSVLTNGLAVRAAAVSGLERFDRRARLIRALESLATSVVRNRAPLWLDKDRPAPPKLKNKVDAYLDESQAGAVAIVPLLEKTTAKGRRPYVLGVIVFEWFEKTSLPAQHEATLALTAEHAALVLGDAMTADRSLAGRLERQAARDGLLGLAAGALLSAIKPLLFLAAFGGAAFALTAIETDLTLPARGTLEPQSRREVFARSDGEVAAVHVEHGATVAAGAVLAELRNESLALRLQTVSGQRRQLEKTIEALKTTQLSSAKLPADEQRRLVNELESQRQSLAGVVEQEALLKAQINDLRVLSPIDAVVTTWNATETLLARPVSRGQILLSLADPTGPWALEVKLPEDRLGTIIDAQKATDEPLEVSFVLATAPEQVHRGKVHKIAQRAELDERQRNTVLVVVEFDKAALREELLRPGAAASVKFYCGKRPMGVVWFYDLAAWFQREVWFRVF